MNLRKLALLLLLLVALALTVLVVSGGGAPTPAPAGGAAVDPADAATPPPTDTVRVPGLHAGAEILRDRWGIGHVYAPNEHDMFFAQGFNVARDRLFQLEVWRRQATGTMAEIRGREALDADIGARLLRYRGDLEPELNHYHPRGASIIRAFVAGINAYIDVTERDPALLPPEFDWLGIRPGRWTPEVVVSRHNGLFRNVGAEVANARLVAALGKERALELLDPEPAFPASEWDVERGIDYGAIPDDVLKYYRAARASVRWSPEDLDGSNNWVVAGARTLSGRPFMANDPHRTIALPSLRYWAHIVSPGWNVIGGGEPVLPGLSIGHNEHGAWGLTVFAIDQEDLYVYETNPRDPDRYRYRGEWRAMEVVPETIQVRGAGSVDVALRYTVHGPVLWQDSARHRAYALRAAWLEIGGAPYLASLRMNQARTWPEFRAASAYSHTPSENMVWADTSGTIGWQAVGITPIRRNWHGLLPVPGDGRYEWEGFLPILELPHESNPGRGFIATANEHNAPDEFPVRLGYDWADPWRVARITEVLASGRKLTLGDMMALQQDVVALPARQLVPLLDRVAPTDPRLAAARERLLRWDHTLDEGSVAAAIYVAWEDALEDAVEARVLPEIGGRPVGGLSLRRLIDALLVPDGRLGDAPHAARDSILTRALAAALTELERRTGTADMERWRYGQPALKHIALEHPLADLLEGEAGAGAGAGARALANARAGTDSLRLRLGPLPRPGYGNTPNATGGWRQTGGASFRIIADVGAWDRSVGTNTPGQSGDPRSPHYADLFEPWASGDYFPILFSRERVESVTERRTVLVPGP